MTQEAEPYKLITQVPCPLASGWVGGESDWLFLALPPLLCLQFGPSPSNPPLLASVLSGFSSDSFLPLPLQTHVWVGLVLLLLVPECFTISAWFP